MDTEQLIKELQFKAVRSSGAGGQHVNKVSSKVELSFNLPASEALSEKEKELLLKNLSNKLTKENILILSCQESRSQHRNKELVIERFFSTLHEALIIPKVRKATRPSKSSLLKKAESNRKHSLKKSMRKKPDY